MFQTTTSLFRFKLPLVTACAALSLFALVGCNDDGPTQPTSPPLTEEEQLLADGKEIFEQSCTVCHGHNGEGESGPPLLHSDYVIAERMRPVRILFMGLPNPIDTNPIVVNGIEHNNTMPAIATQSQWDDRQISAVVSYLRVTLNDSTSVNCEPFENEDGQIESECDLVVSPAEAATIITADEVKTLRDSLDGEGMLDM